MRKINEEKSFAGAFDVDGKRVKRRGETLAAENYALRRRRWRGTKAIAAGRRSRFLAGVIPVLCCFVLSITSPGAFVHHTCGM